MVAREAVVWMARVSLACSPALADVVWLCGCVVVWWWVLGRGPGLKESRWSRQLAKPLVTCDFRIRDKESAFRQSERN